MKRQYSYMDRVDGDTSKTLSSVSVDCMDLSCDGSIEGYFLLQVKLIIS